MRTKNEPAGAAMSKIGAARPVRQRDHRLAGGHAALELIADRRRPDGGAFQRKVTRLPPIAATRSPLGGCTVVGASTVIRHGRAVAGPVGGLGAIGEAVGAGEPAVGRVGHRAVGCSNVSEPCETFEVRTAVIVGEPCGVVVGEHARRCQRQRREVRRRVGVGDGDDRLVVHDRQRAAGVAEDRADRVGERDDHGLVAFVADVAIDGDRRLRAGRAGRDDHAAGRRDCSPPAPSRCRCSWRSDGDVVGGGRSKRDRQRRRRGAGIAFDARAVGNRHHAGADGHVAGRDLGAPRRRPPGRSASAAVHGQRLRRHGLAVDRGAGQRLPGEAAGQHHRLRLRPGGHGDRQGERPVAGFHAGLVIVVAARASMNASQRSASTSESAGWRRRPACRRPTA